VKETSVVSIVAQMDLMNLAKDIIVLYYKTNEALLMLVIAYALILLYQSRCLRGSLKRG
jgi:polar amino acid transport system permease protein